MSRNARRHQTISIGDRPINLTQVLKLAGIVQSGGEAKSWIAEGRVKVNGEVELRKRRQMKPGDTVALEDGPTLVLREGADPEEPQSSNP
jgi:ribosome-associated protein